jgi:hypothetical protein
VLSERETLAAPALANWVKGCKAKKRADAEPKIADNFSAEVFFQFSQDVAKS